jgi:hypothetical protein
MQNPVNHRFPQNFQMFSTTGPFWEAEAGAGELALTLKAGSSTGFQADSE